MSMPAKYEIDDMEKRYKAEIPLLTTKADILIREADALEFKADNEPDDLKSLKFRQQACTKRIQSAKLISEVDEKLSKLKLYGRP